MTDLVYIMSPSYSGSTLLTFLLATHPKIGTIGELKATSMGDVDLYHCSCGARIRQCPFWANLSQELDRLGVAFDVGDFGTHFRSQSRPLIDRVLRAGVRGPVFETVRSVALRLIPGCRREFGSLLEKNRVLIETILRLRNADLFLDGSKDPVRLYYLLSANLWNIKVIYMIRDGRGTATSHMKHYDTSMHRAALEWRSAHQECRRVLSQMPTDSWIQIRYEQLCQEPDHTMEAVFGFLGLDPRQAKRDFVTVEHHILGNPMRLNSSQQIALDEKWKTTLTTTDRTIFDRIAGALNRQYGYV